MHEIVSVIIPVYNVPSPVIDRCIKSICMQSYSDLEIILVDDGSDEQYLNYLDALASDDSRIKLIRQSNQGVSAARNTGLRCAAGEWVLFVDADDWLEPTAIYEGITALHGRCSDLFIMGHSEEHVDSKQNVRRCLSFSHISAQDKRAVATLDLSFQLFSCWGKIYRKSLVSNLSFPTDMTWGEDTCFVYSVLENTFSDILLSTNALYHYEVDTQISGKASTSFKESRFRDLEKLDKIYIDFYQNVDSWTKRQIYGQLANHVILLMRTARQGNGDITSRVAFLNRIAGSELRKIYLQGMRWSWGSRKEKFLFFVNCGLLWRYCYLL